MIPEEFKTQVFKTPEQWGSGLFYRLDAKEKEGVTLYSTPGFAELITQVKNGINNPAALAADKCGQIFLFDSDTASGKFRLYLYDCETQNLEQLLYITYSNSDQKDVQCPQRILLSKYTLWVNDTVNNKILAFSRDDYQIKNVIDKLNGGEIEPVDIGLDEYGNLYVLIKKSNEYLIIKYDEYGNPINDEHGNLISFSLNVGEAVGLASGKNHVLYVIDRVNNQLRKYIERDSNLDLAFTVDVSDKPPEKCTSELQPSGIIVDGKGNIFLCELDKNESNKTKGLIRQFDQDGNSLGIVKSFNNTINGLAVDFKGDLYASCNKGIYKFSTQDTYTKAAGTYYSKTLDSGIRECQWHRMILEMDLPPGTIVEISYSSSDDPSLQKEIDSKITAEKITKKEKADFIDNMLKWSEPEKFSSNYSKAKEKSENQQLNSNEPEKNLKHMLFQGKQGRYLWLRVKLSTFDEKVKPTLTQMRILYPRISYLRYLPAIYQENPVSKDFVERFLSIFETASYDLETEISHIYKYFDPGTVPFDFLNWLASWLNVALEEDWQEEKKRQLIQEAYSLYKQKGTPSGIERLIEIYTGNKPVLLEHSKIEKPMVLRENGDLKLGINSFLIETPLTGLRLGDEAILGKIVLQDSVQSSIDPFLPMAHRFTVTLDISDDEKVLFEKQLRTILDEEKPAHTMYTLRFSSSANNLKTYLDINSKLDYYNPLRLGDNATIGSVIVVTHGERGSRVGQNSVLGVDTELI